MILRSYTDCRDYLLDMIPGPTDEEWIFLERSRDFRLMRNSEYADPLETQQSLIGHGYDIQVHYFDRIRYYKSFGAKEFESEQELLEDETVAYHALDL